MHRRDFITIVGGVAAVCPFEALAQASPKRRVIAWITGVTQTTSSTSMAGFLKGMRERAGPGNLNKTISGISA
jgi:hypothetical protein